MSNVVLVRAALLLSAIALPLSAGCAVESVASEESKAESSAALTNYAYYQWNQYQGHVTVMWPVSQGVCYLTGMGGAFSGTGENVHLEIDNGYWVLTGASQQNSVSATASCVSWTDLGANGGYGYQTWGASSYGGNACSWGGACGSNSTMQTTKMWNGFNFCSLSWISGNFGNDTDITSWFDGNDWYLRTWEGVTQSSAYGQSVCFGLKIPHYLAQAGTQTWRVGQGPVYLGQADQMMCAIAEVSGTFRGSGEHVQIQNLNGAWYLTGSSMQPNTSARAACLWLHQR